MKEIILHFSLLFAPVLYKTGLFAIVHCTVVKFWIRHLFIRGWVKKVFWYVYSKMYHYRGPPFLYKKTHTYILHRDIHKVYHDDMRHLHHPKWVTPRISERISCDESATFFENIAYISHIRHNHSTFPDIATIGHSKEVNGGISANVNNLFGLFTAHYFTNSSSV